MSDRDLPVVFSSLRQSLRRHARYKAKFNAASGRDTAGNQASASGGPALYRTESLFLPVDDTN